MKSVTDLGESCKLAEILPKETADMCWESIYDEDHIMSDYRLEFIPFRLYSGIGVPAWSLAALCNAIEITEDMDFSLTKGGYDIDDNHKYIPDEWFACYENTSFEDVHDYVFINKHSTEIIDAVVELIVELKNRNLL